jgi:hypothetical protein
VNHHVRTKLDEIKRTELERLRHLATKEYELRHGMDTDHLKIPPEHLDLSNPHTFEIEDLRKLILKVTWRNLLLCISTSILSCQCFWYLAMAVTFNQCAILIFYFSIILLLIINACRPGIMYRKQVNFKRCINYCDILIMLIYIFSGFICLKVTF